MPKSHTVQQNETLSKISILYYGIASKYPLIIGANSYLGDRVNKGRIASDGSPLIYVGDILTIPVETDNITNPLNNNSAQDKINTLKDDIITIKIDGKIFKFFTDFSLRNSISEFDTLTLATPYEDSELYRETFQPLKYKECAIYYGKDLNFNGVLLAPVNETEPTSEILTLSFYPKCGVLLDCPFPYSTYPLEFNGMDFKQICEESAKIFGVKVDFRGSAGAVFEKVSPEPTQKVMDFLIDLAKQRGFLITNNVQGDLLVWKITASPEFEYLEEGQTPFISCTPAFDPQKYFSEITGLNPETETTEADSYTWKNPFLEGVIRPSVIDLKDVDNADLQGAVESYAGRMFGNAGKYQVVINTHKNKDGLLFSSNQIIAVLAPKSNIYKRYQFLVNSCTLDRSADDGDTTTFDLELPGARTGELPKDLPWEA